MALNTIVAVRAWLYSHNIGRQAQAGMGFSQPVGGRYCGCTAKPIVNGSFEKMPLLK